MIHRDVEIVDLDPQTWRHLGEIFPIAEWGELRHKIPGVITILHDEGQVLRADLPVGIKEEMIPEAIDDPEMLAKQILEANPNLTRVQIFERSRLRAYSDAVQRLDWTTLSSADFYRKAWQLAQTDPHGLFYYPAGLPRMQVLENARRLIQDTPDDHHLVLGVYDEGKPYFSLIVRVNAGQITLVTTFDALTKYGVDTRQIPSSPDDEQVIVPLVETHFGMVAHSLFCDRATLNQLLDQNATLETL